MVRPVTAIGPVMGPRRPMATCLTRLAANICNPADVRATIRYSVVAAIAIPAPARPNPTRSGHPVHPAIGAAAAGPRKAAMENGTRRR